MKLRASRQRFGRDRHKWPKEELMQEMEAQVYRMGEWGQRTVRVKLADERRVQFLELEGDAAIALAQQLMDHATRIADGR